jgi:peroxiredoxin
MRAEIKSKFEKGIPMSRLKCCLGAVLLMWGLSAVAGGFVLQDTQGHQQRLADYRGKWVLVNFWATWCPPCLAEVPELVSLHNAHKDKDLVVIGIAMDSTPESVAEFARRKRISYPLVLGSEKDAVQIGQVEVLPTSFLYGPEGKLEIMQVGELTREGIEAFLRKQK